MTVPVIEVDGLRKRYGDVVAVDGVSFTVEEGEVFGLLGRNGAGKTTTVECIEGLREPDGGRVSVLGLDPRRDARRLREVLGAQLQDTELPGKVRAREAVRLYRSFYRDGADPHDLLAQLGLDERAGAFFEDLSGGQQQRLAIALALVGKPRVAILDELTTGLDPQARRDVWGFVERVRDTGVTVVLVSHNMEEVERLCDRVAIIDRGRLVALDTPSGLVRGVSDEQRVEFRPSGPLDGVDLAALPEVAGVAERHGTVRVTGTGNLVHAVTTELARAGVVAEDLRVERATLEDAFVALTGRRFGGDGVEEDR